MTWFQSLAAKLPHDTIDVDGKPYLTRYYLNGKPTYEIGEPSSMRLHHFHASDQGRDLHSHPFEGWSIILAGGYIEERRAEPDSVLVPITGGDSYERIDFHRTTFRVLTPGSTNRIGLEDFHRAELIDPVNGCWTLFVTGKRVCDWGFWSKITGEFTPQAEYVR